MAPVATNWATKPTYSRIGSGHSINGLASWITCTLEVGTFAGEANPPPDQLAAADGGDGRDRRPLVDRGAQSVEGGDALVADKDIHVTAELALLRQHPVHERGAAGRDLAQ